MDIETLIGGPPWSSYDCRPRRLRAAWRRCWPGGRQVTMRDGISALSSVRDPPYLHPPVTASMFWAIALRVQEFDKGRGLVGFLPIGQGL